MVNPNSNLTPSSQPHPIVRIFLWNILILFAFVFAFEIYLRVDKDFEYLKSNSQFTRGNEMHYNSMGYRDEEFNSLIRKEENPFLIFAAGDSTTFGSGVSWQNTYPKKLQRLLNDKQPETNFVVVNGGGQAYGVKHVFEQVMDLKFPVQPSVVILGLSSPLIAKKFEFGGLYTLKKTAPSTNQNEIKFIGLKMKLERFLLNLHASSHQYIRGYAFIDQEVRPFLYKKKILKEKLDRFTGSIMAYAFDVEGVTPEIFTHIQEAYSQLEETIKKLKQSSMASGKKIILMGIPDRFTISNDPIDNLRNIDKKKMRIDPMDQFKSISKKYQVPYADLRERMVHEREKMLSGQIEWNDLYIRNDYAHLNDLGHELAAEILFNTLRASGFISQN